MKTDSGDARHATCAVAGDPVAEARARHPDAMRLIAEAEHEAVHPVVAGTRASRLLRRCAAEIQRLLDVQGAYSRTVDRMVAACGHDPATVDDHVACVRDACALLRADLAAAHDERAHLVACVEQAEALAAGHLSRVREVEAELVARAGVVEAARDLVEGLPPPRDGSLSIAHWTAIIRLVDAVLAHDGGRALPAPPQAAPRVGQWCSGSLQGRTWMCLHLGTKLQDFHDASVERCAVCGCHRPPVEG